MVHTLVLGTLSSRNMQAFNVRTDPTTIHIELLHKKNQETPFSVQRNLCSM